MAKLDFDKYQPLYASRTSQMRSSAMRDLMSIVARPEVISLAGGLPDTESFPVEIFLEVMDRVGRNTHAQALQYGPTEGFEMVKGHIVSVMAAEGIHVLPENLLITTGAQQGIDLATKTLIDPGDIIIAEAPTYPGAIPPFTSYEAQVHQIAIDDDGLRIDLLERELARLRSEGRTPKFAYVIPNFQNPAGVSLSLERRHALLKLAAEYNFLILEDNPYGQLRFEGEPIPSLYALDTHGLVIYLGSFSKILSPGLRLGWMAAPAPLLHKFNLGAQATDLCPSSFTQYFVAEYFSREGLWQSYIERLNSVYVKRRDAMLDALKAEFPSQSRWTHPQGGFFIWVTLPEFLDTEDLLVRAIEEEYVAFVPGRAAYLNGEGKNTLRLAFCSVPVEQIAEGIQRLGKVIREQTVLYKTLSKES